MNCKKTLSMVIAGLFLLTGCSVAPPDSEMMLRAEGDGAYANRMVEQTVLNSSLFSSDTKLLSNEAVRGILDAPIPERTNAKIAMLNLTPGDIGLRMYRRYWQTEEHMDLQRRYVEALENSLDDMEQVREVVSMPSVMTSPDMSLPQMREAAVRLQADWLLIYGVRSDIFQQNRFLEKDRVKAFATCEALLFDTRTGVIPFTTVQTKKYVTEKQAEDFDSYEMRQRAESEATLLVLKAVGAEIRRFLAKSAGDN